ncbi:MAG: S16 family serine protease, partial [Candidatus Micrarchaeota archaeon]
MRRVLLTILLVAVIAAFIIGYETKKNVDIIVVNQTLSASATPSALASAVAVERKFSTVLLKLPAVDRDGNGALADLTIESSEGSGKIFIGFSKGSPLLNTDTQDSIQTALRIASKVTGKPLENKDVFYTISAQSDVVGGKSAGAAVTVGTMAVVLGEKLNANTVITGTIEEDGTIGQVGRILEKAKAVKSAGFTIFLVPAGEAVQKVAVETCREQRTQTQVIQECTQAFHDVDVAK